MPSQIPERIAQQFARAARQAPEFVGMQMDDAVAAARESHEQVRVWLLDKGRLAWNQDHRPERLNLLILNDTVVRAAFF